MNRVEFLGGFYIDARRLEFACLMPLLGIVRTHLGDLQPLAHQLPLFTRIANVPEFQIAGAANEAIGTVHYHDGDWFLDPRVSHGENGCIFDCDGVLQIIEPAPDQTSQGYRYVAPDCRLVLGDETILKNGVSKYTDLSAAQDGSFLIGQGHDVGGIVVYIDGQVRMIQAGACYESRAYLEGDVATVSFYDVQPDGLTAYIVHAAVDELRALQPVGQAPTVPAPNIAVTSYDPILKAGEPWALEFASVETRFLVTKDARDRLWIEAQNAAGSDRTGSVRQLTIEGPDPEPEPEPAMLGRYWLQPNIGSRDLLEMFERFEGFTQIDVFCLYIQEILADTPGDPVGENTYPNLVAAGAFRQLDAVGIPLVIEMGAIKEWDCTAQKNIAGMQLAVQRVHDAGGEVAAFSMDEPLTANQFSNGCHQSLEACADAVAAYVHAVRALGPILVGWLEAWPEVSIGDQQHFLALLAQRKALPDYWHPDIDWNRARNEHKDPAEFIRDCQATADRYRITFGVFVNSTVDPIINDATHYGNLHQIARKIQTIHPLAAHVHVAAWCRRGTSTGPQDVPDNLSRYGLVTSLEDTRAVFEPSQPQPTPEIDPMDYKLVDYVLHIKGTKPSSADGKVTATLHDDRVASIQPDGKYESRAPGTDAAYEQAYDRNGMLFYEPVAGQRYAVGYRVGA